jgi:hypothetical protein
MKNTEKRGIELPTRNPTPLSSAIKANISHDSKHVNICFIFTVILSDLREVKNLEFPPRKNGRGCPGKTD